MAALSGQSRAVLRLMQSAIRPSHLTSSSVVNVKGVTTDMCCFCRSYCGHSWPNWSSSRRISSRVDVLLSMGSSPASGWRCGLPTMPTTASVVTVWARHLSMKRADSCSAGKVLPSAWSPSMER